MIGIESLTDELEKYLGKGLRVHLKPLDYSIRQCLELGFVVEIDRMGNSVDKIISEVRHAILDTNIVRSQIEHLQNQIDEKDKRIEELLRMQQKREESDE